MMKKWKAYSKIVKVIESCESREQLKVARSMLSHFEVLFKEPKHDGILRDKLSNLIAVKYNSYS